MKRSAKKRIRRRRRAEERRALMRGRRAALLLGARMLRRGMRMGSAAKLVRMVEVHRFEVPTDGRGWTLQATMGGLLRGFRPVHRPPSFDPYYAWTLTLPKAKRRRL